MFDTTTLDARMAVCKLTVKDPADLLILRQILFEELSPQFMWIFYTSVLEWEQLSDTEKEQHTKMCETWNAHGRKA